MNTALWVVQILLAVVFAGAGVLKLTRTKEQLRPNLPWVEDFSAGTVRFIGAVELAGAVGLVVPAVTGIAPILTPLAASGLAVTMVLAALTHARRREPPAIVVNLVLLSLAAFVAWGRFGTYAF